MEDTPSARRRIHRCRSQADTADLEGPQSNTTLSATRRAIEAGRDVDEFREIVELHEVHLSRTALRLSGNAEIARDLVQETLVRAWESFAQFTSGSNARAWLVTILMRLFYDQLKHARVISKAEPEIRTLEPAACDLVPQQIPDAQLWAAVDALEPGLRGVVERCYVQDMTYKAIAEELRLPIGTIGTRLRRAREQLKLLLDTGDLRAP